MAAVKRVTILTAGHLSTSPRMLKAADSLHEEGYRIRMVSTTHVPWAAATDCLLRRTRTWEWSAVDYEKSTARIRQLATGARLRAAQSLASTIGADRVPLPIAVRAYSRLHDELVRAAAAEPSDLLYGGTTGALAATAQAAKRLGVPYALDLEDFYSASQCGAGSGLAHALAARIERQLLPAAVFLTAGSPLIAEAYERGYGIPVAPICNTFPLPHAAPDICRGRHADPLRLYWFSQTIGPGRGLEDAILAAGIAGVRAELHVRGRSAESYVSHLRALKENVAPMLELHEHEPGDPDAMVDLSRPYDVGLSCEDTTVLNHRWCLGNKIFTYLLAGLAVVLSGTDAQRQLAADLGAAALLYQPGDIGALAAGLRRWARDPASLAAAKQAAWAAACRRWHWEHPSDRGALVSAVRTILG
jgi:hypothetical protein